MRRRSVRPTRPTAPAGEDEIRLIPNDPLVRWLVGLCVFVSIGIPLILALVLAVD